MGTNKFTRDFSDFGAYPFPGKNIPEYYDHKLDAGDGNPGTQWMYQSGLAAYGPRHIIAGIAVQSGGTDKVTGTAGYYMWDGQILEWTIDDVVIGPSEYAYISGDGSMNVAAISRWGSGIMVAQSGAGGITNIIQDWNGGIQRNIHVNRVYVDSMTGLDISGAYSHLIGTQFTGDNVYIDNGYYVDLTGDNVSGQWGEFGELTGNDFGFDTLSGNQITGTSGVIGDLIVQTFNILPIGTVLMYNGSALGGTISTRTAAIGSEFGDTITMGGWYVCNGQSGTPNLIDRFIMGSDAVGSLGGEASVTLSVAQMPTHNHTCGTHSNLNQNKEWGGDFTTDGNWRHENELHSHNIGNAGGGAAHENRPPFYSMVYITRIS